MKKVFTHPLGGMIIIRKGRQAKRDNVSQVFARMNYKTRFKKQLHEAFSAGRS